MSGKYKFWTFKIIEGNTGVKKQYPQTCAGPTHVPLNTSCWHQRKFRVTGSYTNSASHLVVTQKVNFLLLLAMFGSWHRWSFAGDVWAVRRGNGAAAVRCGRLARRRCSSRSQTQLTALLWSWIHHPAWASLSAVTGGAAVAMAAPAAWMWNMVSHWKRTNTLSLTWLVN